MNPIIADRWIAALRSGKYKQTTGVLCREGAYCCLGVLCELAIEDGIPMEKIAQMAYGSTGADSEFYEFEVLPAIVRTWAGMATSVGGYGTDADMDIIQNTHTLAYRNDRGATFKEIADLIEKHKDVL